MPKYDEHKKKTILARYAEGESVSAIAADSGISRSTIYAWIKSEQQSKPKKEYTKRDILNLENKIARLQGIIEIPKKAGCSPNDPLEVKLPALEALQGQYSVHMLCEALDVPRGTYYNFIFRNKRDNTWFAKRKEELRLEIQKIYDDSNQIFGSKKIFAVLKERGFHTSVETVRLLMVEMGISSIRNGAKSDYDKGLRQCKNYLNHQFDTTRPDEVWVSDVTYFRWEEKEYYICAIIDLYARRVLAHKIGKSNSTQLVHSTFKLAYSQRKPTFPLTFHTDRGANYRSYAMCQYLKSLGVTQSFSRAHVPYDNSVMETFFANLKREELYRTKYRSENEFRAAVDSYIQFYNEKRPHAKLAYKTPVKKEQEYWAKQALLMKAD